MATTIRAWHGGQHDDPRWFTSARDWAITFGADVRLYEITADRVLELHEDDIDELTSGLHGYDADAALYDLVEREGAGLVILHGWERGVCYLADPRRAEIREVESYE